MVSLFVLAQYMETLIIGNSTTPESLGLSLVTGIRKRRKPVSRVGHVTRTL
jgi:hypothetical protein